MVKFWKVGIVAAIVTGAAIASVAVYANRSAEEGMWDPWFGFIAGYPVYMEVFILALGDWDGWINLGGVVTPVSGTAGIYTFNDSCFFAKFYIQNGEDEYLKVGIVMNESVLTPHGGIVMCVEESYVSDEILYCEAYSPNYWAFLALMIGIFT